jgi:hypothetical protein
MRKDKPVYQSKQDGNGTSPLQQNDPATQRSQVTWNNIRQGTNMENPAG